MAGLDSSPTSSGWTRHHPRDELGIFLGMNLASSSGWTRHHPRDGLGIILGMDSAGTTVGEACSGFLGAIRKPCRIQGSLRVLVARRCPFREVDPSAASERTLESIVSIDSASANCRLASKSKSQVVSWHLLARRHESPKSRWSRLYRA